MGTGVGAWRGSSAALDSVGDIQAGAAVATIDPGGHLTQRAPTGPGRYIATVHGTASCEDASGPRKRAFLILVANDQYLPDVVLAAVTQQVLASPAIASHFSTTNRRSASRLAGLASAFASPLCAPILSARASGNASRPATRRASLKLDCGSRRRVPWGVDSAGRSRMDRLRSAGTGGRGVYGGRGPWRAKSIAFSSWAC